MDVDAILLQVRPLVERLLHQVFERRQAFLLRHLDWIERHDVRILQRRIFHPAPAERVLQHDFLLQQVGLGDQHVLRARRNLRLRARHFDRRYRARRQFLLVVFVKLPRRIERQPLQARVLVERHQIPVQVQHRRNRGRHLLLQLQLGIARVVARNPYVAVVHRRAEPLQQVLRNIQVQAALRQRIQQNCGSVGGGPRAAVVEAECASTHELLAVSGVEALIVLHYRIGLIQHQVALRRREMPEISRNIDNRVRLRDLRADLSRDAAAGAHSRAARQAGAAHVDARQAHRLRSRRDRRRRRPQRAAHPRSLDILARHQRAVTLDFNIDVVLERQRHHVARAQVQAAGSNQPAEASRVGEIHRRHRALLVWSRQEAQRPRMRRQNRVVGRLCRSWPRPPRQQPSQIADAERTARKESHSLSVVQSSGRWRNASTPGLARAVTPSSGYALEVGQALPPANCCRSALPLAGESACPTVPFRDKVFGSEQWMLHRVKRGSRYRLEDFPPILNACAAQNASACHRSQH